MRWINRRPGRPLALFLAALPFVLTLIAYGVGSSIRRAENPNDKLLPAPEKIFDTAHRLAFEADKRSGDILLWTDTALSLERLFSGLAIAALIGLAFGLIIGLFPMARAALASSSVRSDPPGS